MAINDIEGGRNEPRKVKLRSRKHSFGFKVRGQVTEGGPRWLIDGKEYRNLQTVSEVYPESAADDGGVQPGDKILSINGIEVEGIEHERFKELMKNSGDEVELVVLTPNEAKMLDIPSSVTIHRSDGSVLSIRDPDVLRSQNIDQAIKHEEEKAANVDSKVHSTVIEMDSVENLAAEGELHNEDADDVVNEGEDTNEVHEEDEHKTKDELNVSIEIPEEPESGAQTEDGEDGTDQDLVENESEEKDLSDKDLGENSTAIVNIDDEEELKVVETSFTESTLDHEDSQEISDNIRSNCTSGQETESTDNTCSRKYGKGKKKRFLPKRPKRRQFSPDIFNDLSPYYSRIKIKPFEIKQRPTHSWKYHQRPTSLSVLHPSDALRLESEDSRTDCTAWSSNLGRRRTTSSEISLDDEKSRLRSDVYNIYQNVELRSKLLRMSQRKMTGLSHQQYTSAHTQQTLNT